MEVRKLLTQELEGIFTDINLNEIEINQIQLEKFISESELGLDMIYNPNKLEFKTRDEIESELNLDDIYEVYYIKIANSVKLIYNNGCINVLQRV